MNLQNGLFASDVDCILFLACLVVDAVGVVVGIKNKIRLITSAGAIATAVETVRSLSNALPCPSQM